MATSKNKKQTMEGKVAQKQKVSLGVYFYI